MESKVQENDTIDSSKHSHKSTCKKTEITYLEVVGIKIEPHDVTPLHKHQ
jgi:hypothetical protein